MDAFDHTEPPADPALRVKAIESLLVEKGIVDPSAIDEIIDIFQHKIGPRNGAKVVARAWSDPVYKTRLLTDATTAIAELGFSGAEGEDMMVLMENADVHNVVVTPALLPLACAGTAACLVQVGPLPNPHCARAARRAGRVWRRDRFQRRSAGFGTSDR